MPLKQLPLPVGGEEPGVSAPASSLDEERAEALRASLRDLDRLESRAMHFSKREQDRVLADIKKRRQKLLYRLVGLPR